MRNGKLTSIIFVRDTNSKGQEISGYIDYAHRLRSTNFEPYFERRKKVGGRGALYCHAELWGSLTQGSGLLVGKKAVAEGSGGGGGICAAQMSAAGILLMMSVVLDLVYY